MKDEELKRIKSILASYRPDLQPISEAPKSLMDFPEYVNASRKNKDIVGDRLILAESKKEYKAVNAALQGCVIRNPICRKHYVDAYGATVVVHTKPRIVQDILEQPIKKSRRVL